MSFTGFDLHIKESLKNRYDVLNLQGKGGMANVYRAIQLGLDREVAIKVIHPSLVNDEETIKRFKLEAKSAAKLSHPNIITVYDVGEAGEIVYICLEFLDGGDLSDMLKKEGRLRVDQLLSIMVPITSALAEIHDHSLIHRDIKSSNIYITRKGKPVLLDFGIATFKESSSGTTLPGTVIGTPEYMSPEQANGRIVGPESDIYSLGVVMFQCLSGAVPFSGDSPISTLVKISQGVMPELDKESLEIPQWLYDVVMKCLAKDPENRFRSAQDLLKSFQAKKIVESAVSPKSKTANYDEEISLINRKYNNTDSIEEKIKVIENSPSTIKEIYNLNNEVVFLKTIRDYQKKLKERQKQSEEKFKKAISLLLKGSYEELLQQTKDFGDSYSYALKGNEMELIHSLAHKMETVRKTLADLGGEKELKDDGIYVKLSFELTGVFQQLNLMNFLNKQEHQQVMKASLHLNDQYHESIIAYMKDEKVEHGQRKALMYKLLESIKVQGVEVSRNEEFRALLIDLHNHYIYKNNKIFRLKSGAKEANANAQSPGNTKKGTTILNFDEEFNDLMNDELLKHPKLKSFLSLSNEEIERETLNRLAYKFLSPRVKDNGFHFLLDKVQEMVSKHQKRYKYYDQYRVGEDLFQFNSANERYDLRQAAGRKAWDENLKEYLKRLKSNDQYLQFEQLGNILNQTYTKLVSQLKPYLAQTAMPSVKED